MTRFNTESDVLIAAAAALAGRDGEAFDNMLAQVQNWLGDFSALSAALEAMQEAAYELAEI